MEQYPNTTLLASPRLIEASPWRRYCCCCYYYYFHSLYSCTSHNNFVRARILLNASLRTTAVASDAVAAVVTASGLIGGGAGLGGEVRHLRGNGYAGGGGDPKTRKCTCVAVTVIPFPMCSQCHLSFCFFPREAMATERACFKAEKFCLSLS